MPYNLDKLNLTVKCAVGQSNTSQAECHDLPDRRWTDTRQGACDPPLQPAPCTTVRRQAAFDGGFDAGLMHTALTGAPAPWAPYHRLFIVNDENRWEIAGSYQIARCVKVPGRRALSVGNRHGWKASFAKAGVARSNPAGALTFSQLSEGFQASATIRQPGSWSVPCTDRR